MTEHLLPQRATYEDLPAIIKLLAEDELGKTRESFLEEEIKPVYQKAFDNIIRDPNHYLMVLKKGNCIVGTCHLTLLPSLTFQGATRLQIEAVRVASEVRGCGVGEAMFHYIVEYAKQHDVRFLQLTTNKKRGRAKKFYERLGFQATHEGMKYDLS